VLHGKTDTREVAATCRRIAQAVLGGHPLEVRERVSLTIVTARARGPLAAAESKTAFARAVLSNAVSRERLAGHLERVLFTAGAPGFMAEPYDAFGLQRITLDARNDEDALLASARSRSSASRCATSPAPAGNYWDGALVDYHLLLPTRA